MVNHQIETELGAVTLNENAIHGLIKGVLSDYFRSQKKATDNLLNLELIDKNSTRVVESEQGGLNTNLHVQMTYGALLPGIIPNLRSTIQREVLTFSGLEVKEINIYVDRIRIPQAKENS